MNCSIEEKILISSGRVNDNFMTLSESKSKKKRFTLDTIDVLY